MSVERLESRLLRANEDWVTRTCFCGNPLPKVFSMAWCDDCLNEVRETGEDLRVFIRRKEVARGRI